MSAQPAIESPCVRVCAISGQTGRCVGCGRTLKEIANWSGLTAAERQAIMAALPERLAQANPPSCAT
ncbi:MAG: DUF1289 domain-containing protein [Alphaproteobacteria bacterium]|nr:DUF1289 domain-containing protein [Alphaproteobacteria bacterium]